MGVLSWLSSLLATRSSHQSVPEADQPAQSQEPARPTNADQSPALRSAEDYAEERVKVHYLASGEAVSFPRLPTRRLRTVGSGYYLTWNERDGLQMGHATLVPEPTNRSDPNAVAILRADGRKVGYLSRAQAASYFELISRVGALRVECTVDGSKLWLSMPTVPALRSAVARREPGE